MFDKMNAMKGFMPMFQGMNIPAPPIPPMPFRSMPGASGCAGKTDDNKKEKWDGFKSNVETFWGQMRDMQKSSMEATKEQWNTFFGQCMEMEGSFAESLPEELPAMPGMPAVFTPISPKSLAEKVREFKELFNNYAVEQADSFFDFVMQGQEQIKNMAVEAVGNVEAKVEEKKEAAAAPEA